MPRIICRTCGREVYATGRVEQLFADERRCPRCGAPQENDRRAADRRTGSRRVNPPDDPGPPDGDERRVEDRRAGPRRRTDTGGARPPDDSGWLE